MNNSRDRYFVVLYVVISRIGKCKILVASAPVSDCKDTDSQGKSAVLLQIGLTATTRPEELHSVLVGSMVRGRWEVLRPPLAARALFLVSSLQTRPDSRDSTVDSTLFYSYDHVSTRLES